LTTTDDIHKRYDLKALIERETGQQFVRGAMKCPFHSDADPSFTIYEKNNIQKYYCHGCGAGGDIIDFIQNYHSISFNDAKGYITGEIQSAPKPIEKKASSKEQKKSVLDLHPPQMPIKDHSAALEKFNNYKRAVNFKPLFGKVEDVYKYKNPENELMYIKCRLSGGNLQGKSVPFYFDGDKWRCKHPKETNRPLFGGEKINKNTLPVVVVEGEKCAKVKIDGFNVVTWDGGSNGISKADWSIVSDRKVVVIPDRDVAGYKAAFELEEMIDCVVVPFGVKTLPSENECQEKTKSLLPRGDEWTLKKQEVKAEYFYCYAYEYQGKKVNLEYYYNGYEFVKSDGFDIADLYESGKDVSKIIKQEVIDVLKNKAEENQKKKGSKSADSGDDGGNNSIQSNSVFDSITPASQVQVVISKERRDYIESLLTRTKEGSIKQSMANIYTIADLDDYLPKSIFKDVLTGDLHFFDGQSMESYINKLMQYYARNFGIDLSEKKQKDIINYVALENTFNSILSFLDFIEDRYEDQKENPLNELFEHLEFTKQHDIDDCELEESYLEIFDMFFTRALLQIILSDKDRAFANRIVPILQGKQEIGKTTFVKFLAGHESFFSGIDNESLDSGDRNTITKVKGKMLCELEEITSIRRSKIEKAKAFLSNSTYETRKLFSQQDTATVKRTVSFIGTTNNKVFLKDETGNTRFFPVLIDKIDSELYKKIELPKKIYAWYYAKAKRIVKEFGIYDLRSCKGLLFSDKTTAIIEKLREESFETDPLIERIEKHLSNNDIKTTAKLHGVSAQEVLEGIFGKDMSTAYNIVGFSKRVAEVASKLGMYKTVAANSEGVRRNVWKFPDLPDLPKENGDENLEDELPF